MRCEDFEERLADLSAGCLGRPDRVACLRHAGECPRCADLMETARGSGPAAAPEGFLDQILEKTSGRSCSEAHALLCDYADGALSPVESELLEQHLERCSGCLALSEALTFAGTWLPELAVADPGPHFAEGVFQRTSRGPAQERRIDAALAFLRSLSLRPRFALEAAYLGALLLFGLFGLISDNSLHPSLLSSSLAPAELQETANRYTTMIVGDLSARSRRMGDTAETWAADAGEALRKRSAETLGAVGGRFEDTRIWLQDILQEARRHAGEAWHGPVSSPPET